MKASEVVRGRCVLAVAAICGMALAATSAAYAQYSQAFETMPTWTSTWDSSWGNGDATWGIVAGGQSGNYLQCSWAAGNYGSAARVIVYSGLSTNTNYRIVVYMKCGSASNYWMETGYRLGTYTAQNFDESGGSWTLVQKFSNSGGYPNGNSNTWTAYSATVNTGTNTQISIGYKLGCGASGGAPVVGWDTFSMCALPASPTNGTSTANSATQITWGWTKPAGTGITYKGYDQSSGGNLKWTSGADVASYAEGSLTPNTQYQRWVSSFLVCESTSRCACPARYTLANVPGAPTVSNPQPASLKVAASATAESPSNPAGTQYAITITGGAFGATDGVYYVPAAGGTPTTSVVWQAKSSWTAKTVT